MTLIDFVGWQFEAQTREDFVSPTFLLAYCAFHRVLDLSVEESKRKAFLRFCVLDPRFVWLRQLFNTALLLGTRVIKALENCWNTYSSQCLQVWMQPINNKLREKFVRVLLLSFLESTILFTYQIFELFNWYAFAFAVPDHSQHGIARYRTINPLVLLALKIYYLAFSSNFSMFNFIYL